MANPVIDILGVQWTEPTPVPSCGYRVQFRRNTEADYQSGETSGTTFIMPLNDEQLGSYEGMVICDCCDGKTSQGKRFGVNANTPLTFVGSVQADPLKFIIAVSAIYPNTYDVEITGVLNVHSDVGGIDYSVGFGTLTLPKGDTSAQRVFGSPIDATDTITSVDITAISPIFNNGGKLQQYDPINTPPFLGYYDGSGSIPADGIFLPSTVLRQFNVTEVDVDDNPLAGNLIMSVIVDTTGTPIPDLPFDTAIVAIFDGLSEIGSLLISLEQVLIGGYMEFTIPMIKGDNPIDTSTVYTMKLLLPDDTPVGSAVFHLPDF